MTMILQIFIDMVKKKSSFLIASSGAVVVEFSVVLFPTILLCIAILEFGLFVLAQQQTRGSARAATEFLIANSYSADVLTTAVQDPTNPTVNLSIEGNLAIAQVVKTTHISSTFSSVISPPRIVWNPSPPSTTAPPSGTFSTSSTAVPTTGAFCGCTSTTTPATLIYDTAGVWPTCGNVCTMANANQGFKSVAYFTVVVEATYTPIVSLGGLFANPLRIRSWSTVRTP